MSDILLGLLLGFLGGLCVGTACGVLLGKRSAAPPTRDMAGVPLPEGLLSGPDEETTLRENLRQDLRLKYMYDEDKIDSAIQFERERNPQANDIELMRAAIYRW